MQKSETIHLHALLAELRSHLEARGRVDTTAFDRYEKLGVSPLQVHRSKDQHVEALRVLAAELGAELAGESTHVAGEERPSEQSAQHANGEH